MLGPRSGAAGLLKVGSPEDVFSMLWSAAGHDGAMSVTSAGLRMNFLQAPEMPLQGPQYPGFPWFSKFLSHEGGVTFKISLEPWNKH